MLLHGNGTFLQVLEGDDHVVDTLIGAIAGVLVVFSVMFFVFPAGLVLYWITNNVLSIAQQWHINRVVEQEAKKERTS